ncbi:MAG: type I-B CRISPR-associated protein Cas7/Cst2/DevR [[Clostridium] spiroforme]|uniref:Type I-B CRISPR-associated protein Cas7/Cst2/DevR n=1 Tax=Thomasclavelia spiroformis TaxID=29348 RepID=A0A943EFR7_9FIRM|nr:MULTISPECIES: type I-B CRISPR-associated protein Cas7/Cst2/DevR [Thomasclavelia]MBS5588030.1 type I-B CRISPR-associated protein Cas7/Cst2/DevR [Thomasclavelia spiroformis]
MNRNGLTMTIIFQAESANFGEGIGNLTVLKKYSRGDKNQYTYISRQALRYNIIQQLGYDNTPISNESGVVQFAADASIDKYPEVDLFGYMKTVSKKDNSGGKSFTRSAVVRLSNAVSLEPFNSDLDFLTNMGLAKREGYDNAIAQSEIHRSLYAYTITIDLDLVGEDGDISLSADEKINRIEALLKTVMFLYRDIKGRRENLSPLFVIGGVFGRKNPFFSNVINVSDGKLNINSIKSVLNMMQEEKEFVKVGLVNGIFNNETDIISELDAKDVGEVFNEIIDDMKKTYE